MEFFFFHTVFTYIFKGGLVLLMAAKETTLTSETCFSAFSRGVAPRGFYTFHLLHILIFALEVWLELFTYNGYVKSLHDI